MGEMIKVDDKDKLILSVLLEDCRQPLSKIAKEVKLPQQTVSYRIKKLEDSGIIKKYTINVNYPKLGYDRHSLYLNMKNVSVDDVNEYLREVNSIKEISCCYMLHEMSEWQLYISTWTKTLERYDEIQTKVLKKFKEKIDNYLSFQSVKSYTYFARFLHTKKKVKVDIKDKHENVEISDVDWKLIEELKKDSRISAVELSKKLDLSAEAIVRRINNLQKKDIIQRFYPILNIKKMGYLEYTFISRINPAYDEELDAFIEYAKKDSRFNIIIKAVGYINLYYAFIVKDHDELKEVRRKIQSLLGDSVMQEYKVEVDEMIS